MIMPKDALHDILEEVQAKASYAEGMKQLVSLLIQEKEAIPKLYAFHEAKYIELMRFYIKKKRQEGNRLELRCEAIEPGYTSAADIRRSAQKIADDWIAPDRVKWLNSYVGRNRDRDKYYFS